MPAPTSQQIAAREAEIQQLVAREQRDQAGKMLFELIVACAQGGDFANANRLRDMLYNVDPMALSSVIKAGEIIDQAMSGAVDENFVSVWEGLKLVFSEEEFLALYHALEMHKLDQGKGVVKVGSKLDAMLFITKGNINVICQDNGKNRAVKILGPGAMIGENCFQPSFWTVSVATLKPTTLAILRSDRLADLETRFAGFEAKLQRYYEQFDDIPRLLKEQELHRRSFKRFVVNHKMTFQVQGPDGKVDERGFRGELDNVSQGGLAFLLRIVKRENRRMLFGRRLRIAVAVGNDKKLFVGVVVAVTIHDFQMRDYAIHVSFDQPVSEDYLHALLPVEEDQQDSPGNLVDDSSAEAGPDQGNNGPRGR